jgi:plasmid stabilization system protein ParE
VKIKILDGAERDLEGGYHFYERQSAGLGSYFLDSLYSDIDSLSYFGGIHRVIFGYHRLLSKRFPFAVYYKIIDRGVLVMAVLDCRRNPSWIRETLMQR